MNKITHKTVNLHYKDWLVLKIAAAEQGRQIKELLEEAIASIVKKGKGGK